MAEDHVSAWRLLLIVVAMALPGFGIVRAWVDPAGADWSWRLLLTVVALILLWRSFADGWVRHNLRAACIGLSVVIQGWFACEAGLEDVSAGHVLGLMLIGGLTVSLFRSVAEMIGFGLFMLGALGWAYHLAEAPKVPMSLTFAVVLTAFAGMAVVTLSRVRVERALTDARNQLEARVTERTAALAEEVKERRAAEVEAIRANRAKSRFLANMSHELRTPLNAVIGYTEIVQDELGDLERPDLVHDLELAKGGARHLLRMIDDVLDLARIEAGQLEIVVEPVDVGALVTELTRMIEPERARAGVSLEVAVPPDTVVRTDRMRLAQILLNLLSNALKFTERGGVRVTVERRHGHVALAVSDTGIGIPPDGLERLFQPFVQIDDSSTRRRDGTGLGLVLARDLAQRLGGTLTVESEVGRGSTFTLTLAADRR